MHSLARRFDVSAPITVLFMIVVLVCVPLLMGCDDDYVAPDANINLDSGIDVPEVPKTPQPSAPKPGTITASNPTSSSVDLSWTAATDDETPAAELEYRAYYSLEDNLDTVENVLANGTAASDWQKNVTSLTVKSLALDMPYHFNVLVRDAGQNMAAYGGASASTLGGAWQPEETLELVKGQSAYYSRLTVNSKGDVVAYWSESFDYDVSFAVRPYDADTFGPSKSWTGVPRAQWPFGFGFDDRLAIPAVLEQQDGTFHLSLATGPLGDAPSIDPVAIDLPDYIYEARTCTSANGTTMVVWIDSSGPEPHPVRGRVRAASGWGETTLVSETEDHTTSGLEVVCSPDGNHLVLYNDVTVNPRALRARLYDAALGYWMPVTTLGQRYSEGYFVVARTKSGRRLVVWEESDTDGHYYMARSLDGTTWSEAVPITSDTGGALSLAAAGDDVHVFWSRGGAIVTRRLPAGATAWTNEAPVVEDAMDVYQVTASGSPFGDALFAWVQDLTLSARRWSPVTQSWGAIEPLAEAEESIGHKSLHSLIDPRRRATVVWTDDDPESGYKTLARTYR